MIDVLTHTENIEIASHEKDPRAVLVERLSSFLVDNNWINNFVSIAVYQLISANADLQERYSAIPLIFQFFAKNCSCYSS